MKTILVIIAIFIVVFVSFAVILEFVEYRKTKQLLSKMKNDIDKITENIKEITNHK